ncbi:hypothetical protein V6N13_038037 [Hibiscus sabdariffa]
MASSFTAMSSVGSFIAPNGLVMDKKLPSSSNRLSSLASISSSSFVSRRNVVLRRSRLPKICAAKELHFNKDGSAIKKLQVVRCCLEHAASVAKTFLMSDCVVVEIKEPEPVPMGNPMDNSVASRLQELALSLAHKCLSFDFVGTSIDESSEEFGTVQALECLVRLASVRRSLFVNDAARSKFLAHLMTGTKEILQSGQGLADHDNYHEYCRLLGRFRVNYQEKARLQTCDKHELSIIEAKLTWIVHIIAAILKIKQCTGCSMESQEVFDAELSARVLQLINVTDSGLHSQCAAAVDNLAAFYFNNITMGEAPTSPTAVKLAQHIADCPSLFPQPMDQQQRRSMCFDKLMQDVTRSLDSKNRDKFTQNLTVFRHEFRLK